MDRKRERIMLPCLIFTNKINRIGRTFPTYELLLSNNWQLGWKTKLRVELNRIPFSKGLSFGRSLQWGEGEITNLYSSLTPYAIFKSGSSFITSTAAAFMRSNARRSFGFSKPYLSDSLYQSVRMMLHFYFKKIVLNQKRRKKITKAMETEEKERKKKVSSTELNPTAL